MLSPTVKINDVEIDLLVEFLSEIRALSISVLFLSALLLEDGLIRKPKSRNGRAFWHGVSRRVDELLHTLIATQSIVVAQEYKRTGEDAEKLLVGAAHEPKAVDKRHALHVVAVDLWPTELVPTRATVAAPLAVKPARLVFRCRDQVVMLRFPCHLFYCVEVAAVYHSWF